MNLFQTLSPEQVAAQEAARKPKKSVHRSSEKVGAPHVVTLPVGGRSRKERSVPAAVKHASPADLNVLGQHLLAAQMVANGLVPKPATGGSPYLEEEIARNAGRCLIGAHDLPDEPFKAYLNGLAKSALRHSSGSPFEPCSPRTVALLLGGCSLYELEVACERALGLLEFEDQDVESNLSDALATVGYRPDQVHHHGDMFLESQLYQLSSEDEGAYAGRLERLRKVIQYKDRTYSARREWLEGTRGPFAMHLMHNSGYGADLYHRINAIKPGVMIDAMQALSVNSTLIQPHSRRRIERDYGMGYWADAAHPTNMAFAAAVRAVYERPWSELQLSGDPGEDMTKVMARLIIRRLCVSGRCRTREPVLINARCLIGMSLLTGLPTGKLVRFAVEDQKRRGETFMSAATVREAVELVDTSGVFHLAQAEWMEEMENLARELEMDHDPQRAYWAQKLRAMSYPLFSVENYYNVAWVEHEGRDDEKAKYIPRRDLNMVRLTEE
jgi:hypothetical protein